MATIDSFWDTNVRNMTDKYNKSTMITRTQETKHKELTLMLAPRTSSTQSDPGGLEYCPSSKQSSGSSSPWPELWYSPFLCIAASSVVGYCLGRAEYHGLVPSKHARVPSLHWLPEKVGLRFHQVFSCTTHSSTQKNCSRYHQFQQFL